MVDIAGAVQTPDAVFGIQLAAGTVP